MKTKKEIKDTLTQKRIEIQQTKMEAGSLGEETMAVMPEDDQIMFFGKECLALIKNNVATANRIGGLQEAYNRNLPADIKQNIENWYERKKDEFEADKRKLSKICENHPLWERFKDIRGFTAYQMALVLTFMKNPFRYKTPSSLMIYAGQGVVGNMPVNKRNINLIKDYYSKQGKEFNGFNTKFAGRMYVISECLIRGNGYFHHLYSGIKDRLMQRAVNEGSVFEATAADVEKSKRKGREEGVVKLGELYMKDKNNQSLKGWAHRNAMKRISRTLLHLILTEWRKLYGLETRNPYPIDYLGHSSLITLDDVIAWERANKEVTEN